MVFIMGLQAKGQMFSGNKAQAISCPPALEADASVSPHHMDFCHKNAVYAKQKADRAYSQKHKETLNM